MPAVVQPTAMDGVEPNADNVTNRVSCEVEEAIIVTPDAQPDKHFSPCISAFIRVHPR